MLESLMLATEAFGTWGPGPIPEPSGWWEGFFTDLKITDVLVATFTGVLVVATIGLGLSTRSTTRMGQRAYLSVEPQGVSTLTEEGNALAHIGIRNTGHLPAGNVVWTCQIESPCSGSRRKFELTHEIESGSFVIPAGGVMTFGTVRIPARALDYANVKMLKPEAEYCYVWGEVRYKDGFRKNRYTKFCHRYPLKLRATNRRIDAKYARYHDYGNEAN